MSTARPLVASRTALLAALLCAFILASCGSSESSSQPDPAGGDTTEAVSGNDTDGAADRDSAPQSTYSNTERPASGGPAIDEQWPDEAWVPEDFSLTGKSVNITDGGHQSMAMGDVGRPFDDVKEQIIAVNGAPDNESTNHAEMTTLSYDGLLEGNGVYYELMELDAGATGLVVRITAK